MLLGRFFNITAVNVGTTPSIWLTVIFELYPLTDVKLQKDGSVINLDGKNYRVAGLANELLHKCMRSLYVTYRRGRGFTAQQLNNRYLFAYDGDDTENDANFQKRGDKIANKFSKDCKLAMVNASTLSDIYFQGLLYRICEYIHKHQQILMDLQISKIFKTLYTDDPNKTVSYNMEIEVVSEVKKRYKYLDENNLWL